MIAGSLQEITRNDSVSVSTSSVAVCTPRHTTPKRKVLTIRNISPNVADVISISFGINPAVVNTGIVLKQYESFTDANDGAYECYQDQINAICATANGVLAVFER